MRSVLANAASLIGVEAGTRAVSFLTILYLSRTLAPDGMGVVELGLAIFAALYIVSAGGAAGRSRSRASPAPRRSPVPSC
jgi:O-antigen/teichoic acid export membrane protein